MRFLPTTIALALLLSGCGQTGPLYHPVEEAVEAAEEIQQETQTTTP
jgi:predicted small lipoprotein YifL